MKATALLEQLPMGARIRKGDWWQRYTGEIERRDSVGWFERVTDNHCPHFRLVGLEPQSRMGKGDGQ